MLYNEHNNLFVLTKSDFYTFYDFEHGIIKLVSIFYTGNYLMSSFVDKIVDFLWIKLTSEKDLKSKFHHKVKFERVKKDYF